MAIKKEFDIKFGATWHCIVGRNFGSFVTHGMLSRAILLSSRTVEAFPRHEHIPVEHCLEGSNRLTGKVYTETKHFIYFYLGHNAILLFKTQ